MLALTETGGRRNTGERKRPKGGSKKRAKSGKGQKRALLALENNLEDKNDNVKEEMILREDQIHDLMPVSYKSDEHELDGTEVTFEEATVVSDQDCQTVESTLCVDSVQNSNKYVIITLLQPGAQGIIGEELVTATELTEEGDKIIPKKLQKKVLLLQKIDPITTTTVETSENIAQKSKEERKYLDDSLTILNFDEFTQGVDSKEQKDLGNWVNKFQSLSLLYTESGKAYVKCPACTAMFFKASSFEKHISCHLRKEDDRYVCNFCNYNNTDPSEIFNHLNVHQDQCEVCNMNLTRKNSFKKHWDISEMSMTFTVKRDKLGRFICIYCKLGFDLCHQLQKHWFKHSCNSKKTSQCNNCTGLFDTDDALQNHVCLKCPVCGKICDSVHRLRSHTRYEKHYLYCQICSYEFILAVDHEKHMDLHKKIYHTHKDYAHCLESEDRTSFQCELCGKIYHTMSILVLHIHDDHKITEVDRSLNSDELSRISLPEDKDETTSYDLISTLKGDLKCEVDLIERACEDLEESTVEKTDGTENNEGNNQCEPVALCWNRYSIDESSSKKDT